LPIAHVLKSGVTGKRVDDRGSILPPWPTNKSAAVANALNDAPAPFGVTITEIPLTPMVIPRALGRI
jgi:hypothetical protein